MKDRTGSYDIRIGDLVDTEERPYPVVALEIIEGKGVIRFIDKDGVEDFGKPGRFTAKYSVSTR